MAPAYWTPSEIRINARNWNLEGDSQLLELMKSVSDNLLKRANNTLNQFDKLGNSLEKTCVLFENSSNKLSALSKTQFVENRVYDDDEIKPQRNVEITKETKVYNPNETIKVILKNNLIMLANCYEKVSVDLDDSDEDDQEKSTVIYRPKSLYSKRLPAFIGTNEWSEKWHIGLIDSDDESISDKGNPPEEFSDDSAENISLPSIGPTISESGSSVWSINRNIRITSHFKQSVNCGQSSDEEAISSNTFASKTSSEEARRIISEKIVQPDIQNYYIHTPKVNRLIESSDSEEENMKTKVLPQPLPRHRISTVPYKKNEGKVSKISNILCDEPPEFDSDESYKKSIRNLGNELSGSDTEQNNFLNNEVEKRHSDQRSSKTKDNSAVLDEHINKTMKKTVNLFDDNDFDSFMKELNDKTLNKTKTTNISKKVNLFNSDSDTEAINPIVTSPKIFSANEATFFEDSIQPKNNNIKTENNDDYKKSSFVSPNNPSSFFDEEDDLFLSNKRKYVKSTLSSDLLSKTKISNLFDDEPPEDDFDNLFQKSNHKDSNINGTNKYGNYLHNDVEAVVNTQNNIISTGVTNNEQKLKQLNEELSVDITTSVEKVSEKQISDSSNIKHTSLNRNHLKSILFSNDLSDDEDNMFSTKKAQNAKINSEDRKRNSSDNISTAEQDYKIENNQAASVNEESNIKSLLTAPIVPPLDFNVPSSPKINLFEDEEAVGNNFNEHQARSFEIDKEIFIENTTNENVEKQSTESTLDSIESDKTAETIEQNVNLTEMENEEITNSKENTEITSNEFLTQNNSQKDKNQEHKMFDNFMKKDLNMINQKFDLKADVKLVEENLNKNGTKIKENLNSIFFSDAPPDENIRFVKRDQNSLTKEPIQEINPTSYSANCYGLFDDIPPDDLIDDAKKVSDSIFNEDFEGSPEITINKEIQSNYIISDEPPPDDYFMPSTNFEAHSSIKNSNSMLQSKNISYTSQTGLKDVNEIISNESDIDSKKSTLTPVLDKNSVEAETNIVVPKRLNQKTKDIKTNSGNNLLSGKNKINLHKNLDEVDSVSKIAKDLNIDVTALLPGAKRPVKIKEDVVCNKAHVNNDLSPSEIKLSDANIVSNEGKLIGLNKSRAKISIKRRPSTRKARKESYQKSEIDNSILDSQNETPIKLFTGLDELENKNLNSNLHNISVEEIKTISSSKTIFDNIEPEIDKNSSLPENTNENDNIKPRKNIESKTSLFSDTEENFENSDWLSQLSLTKNNQSSTTRLRSDIKKSSSANDTSNNTIINNERFYTKSISNALDENKKSAAYNESDAEKPSLTINRNFNKVPELNFNYNNSKRESSSQINPTFPRKSKNLNSGSIENFNNDDDDDLFSSPFVKVVSPQIPNVITTTIKKHKYDFEKTVSDEDGDEIFKKVIINKHSVEKLKLPEQKNISKIEIESKKAIDKLKNLFSSDDDDDDVLFGSRTKLDNTKSDARDKKKYSKKENKSILVQKSRDNLFDDVGDDDDDLFATSKSSKAPTTSKTVNNKNQLSRGAIPKRLVEKKATKIQDNKNPLADLLDI